MPSRSVKSAERVMEILEYFREVGGPIRLKSVCRRFSYPASSTTALLKTLAALGYLAFERSSYSYYPTRRITELGDWIPEQIEDEAVAAMMQLLNERTGEFIMLGAQNDLYVQYLRVIRSTHSFQVYIDPGTQRPLVRSGLGWALLAAYADDAIRTIYRLAVHRDLITPATWSIEDTMRVVRDVRSRGYSVSHGTVQANVSVVAVRLAPTQTGQSLVVGVSGPTSRIKQNLSKIATLLLDCVQIHATQSQGRGDGELATAKAAGH